MNGHSQLRTGPTFTVDQLGIKDIDGYGHVWYGNYLKFFERGAQRFLGGGRVGPAHQLVERRCLGRAANCGRNGGR